MNLSLGGLTFGVDADGNYGYKKVGADTVTPFNKMAVYYNLGVKNFTPTYASSSVIYNNNNIFVGITSTSASASPGYLRFITDLTNIDLLLLDGMSMRADSTVWEDTTFRIYDTSFSNLKASALNLTRKSSATASHDIVGIDVSSIIGTCGISFSSGRIDISGKGLTIYRLLGYSFS